MKTHGFRPLHHRNSKNLSCIILPLTCWTPVTLALPASRHTSLIYDFWTLYLLSSLPVAAVCPRTSICQASLYYLDLISNAFSDHPVWNSPTSTWVSLFTFSCFVVCAIFITVWNHLIYLIAYFPSPYLNHMLQRRKALFCLVHSCLSIFWNRI